MTPSPTARAYLRVSSAAQVEKYSLAFQRDKALAWAAYQDLGPVQFYEERGVSGKLDDRPQLAALLGEIQPGDTVIVYSLSRLGRGGAVQMLGIVGRIKDAGARLVSLTENIDTETPAGRLMLTILAALAELEVETTRERTAAGRIQAASQGIYPQNAQSLPFGYTRGTDGRIEASDRADDLRLVFQLAQGGRPFLAVASDLNARGVPTPGRSAEWTANTVMKILKTPTYTTGVYPYRRRALPDQPAAWIDMPTPVLVTPDLWEGAQRPRTMNHPYRRPDLYPLTGHIECGCGTPLVGSTNRPAPGKPGKAYRYYLCRARIRGVPTCPVAGVTNKAYHADQVEPQAREALVRTLRSPAALGLLLQQSAPAADPHADERTRLTERRAALIDLHLDGLIDRAEFVRRRQELDERLGALTPAIPLSVPEVPAMHAYADAVEELRGEEYLSLLRLLQVRWQVTPDSVNVVQLNVPQIWG
ncbi:recombinase family protein [Deinococcus sp. 12RED42]|uniref:recombinase family protein n=1 Tax=Deinococcus sp. 12RED42 TaxID=2745872 RepID=UPI001E2953F6|nr:recombinase family protein [Deinococcus sp. 12RED42]MCD0164450.1 recombinase family protein [Deinococcus sp. 12RED42]